MRDYLSPPEGLQVTREGRSVHLKLDRADRRNAITDEMVAAMIDVIETAGSDDTVRVITLTGSGDHFCSGFDLSLRSKPENPPRVGSAQRRMRWQVNRLIPTMLETQTPIVCGATGYVFGLGLQLALASDFTIVSSNARLREPFVDAGFTPDSGATWLLPRLVGIARAKDLLMLGTEISGSTAAEWGLVHAAVDESQVQSSVDTLAARLGAAPTVAVGLTKSLLHRSHHATLDDQLANEALAIEVSSRSQDFREAVRARSEKRAPKFNGL